MKNNIGLNVCSVGILKQLIRNDEFELGKAIKITILPIFALMTNMFFVI